MKPDQSFDGIASKFANNIYGTTKGQLRHLLLTEQLAQFLPSDTQWQTIDIGGGTGVMSAFLADLGHQVHLCDTSHDVLAIAKETLKDNPGITIEHAPLMSLTGLDKYDLLVCHAVLEWLEKPLEALSFLADNMKPGALLSLSFFNRDALLFGNAVYGNFDYIANGLKVKKKVRLNPHQPLVPKAVITHCQSLSLDVLATTGIRCFHDYMKDGFRSEAHYQELIALERQYNQAEPFVWLGKYMHLMLRKPA